MFACIFIPNFSVAAVVRTEPELRACAVAILEGKPPLEKVFAVNEKAGRMGIAPGMTKAQAELCAELALRPRSPLQESAAHAALLDCAQSFSPVVEDASAGTAILDLGGMETLFGPLPEMARVIFERVAGFGLEANVAVAANPDAAVLAARGLPGMAVIPFGQEAERLGVLPIAVLFADRINNSEEKKQAEHLQETLERWGIRTLRAFAALPEVALSERLGQEGLRLQQLARGAASRTLVPVEEPLVFEEAVELEHAIVLLEPLAFLLNRLLEQLCARLSARALATQELRLALELDPYADCEDGSCGISSESDADSSDTEFFSVETPTSRKTGEKWGTPVSSCQTKFTRTLRLPLPMLDAKLFLKLLQLDLNAHPPGAPIVKIHLAAEPVRPRTAQGGLFLPPSPEPEKLELTLARIAGMVGKNKVGAVELLDTHHPGGFRMRRFVAARESRVPKNSGTVDEKSAGEKSAITALRRLRPPLRVYVTLEKGEPVRVLCARKKEAQGDVLWKAGPWRSSGDWWEREAWARDEWDLAVQTIDVIVLYRLVHDLLGRKWFIEGTYD
jgi:protein ImuB